MTDDLNTPAPLDRLSTRELRERADAVARRQWDLGYYWRVARSIPAAEAAIGRLEASEAGIAQASGLLNEILAEREGDPELQEALRPVYLDYLSRHQDD